VDSAVQSYKKALIIKSDYAEAHSNLGNSFKELGQLEAAVKSYERALTIKPDYAKAHFNLGNTFQELGQLDAAVQSYQEALGINPNYVEVQFNLGNAFKGLGQVKGAVKSFKQALAIKPDYAEVHNNLGAIRQEQGHMSEAVKCYEQALAIKPNYVDAHYNLGSAFKDLGQVDKAIKNFEKILEVNPSDAGINYELAELYRQTKEFRQAINFYQISQYKDWEESMLLCLYRLEDYEEFKKHLNNIIAKKKSTVLLGVLSTHYSQNFDVDNPCNFCPNPQDFILHTQVPELLENKGHFMKELLHDIVNIDMEPRAQGRLAFGVQSSGNLLTREEKSFQKLSVIIKQLISKYYKFYKDRDNDLIKFFPKKITFSSSWFVKMQKGGHLNSHIHEKGWISGAVYLSMPKQKKKSHEGAIELSIDGDDYPKRHDRFEKKIIQVNEGDIILFPSSVFHRTIPFDADEERICIAFDLSPD